MAATVPLRMKLVAVSAALALVPLAVVGLLLIDVNSEAVTLLSRDLQLAAIDDVARTVDGELDGAADDLTAVGRALTEPGLEGEARVALALAMVEGAGGLDHVAVYDADGRLIDTIREEGATLGPAPEELEEGLRRSAVASGVATGEAILEVGEAPRVPLVVPLRGGRRVTGFASSLVSLEPVQRRVERVAASRFAGAGGALFVLDGELRILARAGGPLGAEEASEAARGLLAGTDPRAFAIDLSRSGSFVAPDGTVMVGSIATLPERGWAVGVQVPEAVADASLHEMRQIVLVTIAVAMGLALLVGVLVARRVTAPLSQLTAFARDLAARRFDRRVEVRSRDELATLGQALSSAAADLEASEAKLGQEAAIRADLGRYLPAELVEKVVRREQDMALGGARRTLTVLFADVVGFTPLTERLEPEAVVAILNELFTILTGIVFRHGGTVDKFIGDCVMALFGAPTPHDDHASRALCAAEEMLAWLEIGNAGWQERYGVAVRLAIGVHTGEVVVGNIGSEQRMEYTAIGDVVNVAARLEAVARPQQILLSMATRDAAGDGFDFVDAGEHRLAGRAEPVRLFELRT